MPRVKIKYLGTWDPEANDYVYSGPNGRTMRRVPYDMPANTPPEVLATLGSLDGNWGLYDNQLNLLDQDQYRHDLSERHNIELVYT